MKLFDLETYSELSNQELTALSGGHSSGTKHHHEPDKKHKNCHYYRDKDGKLQKHNEKDYHKHHNEWWPCDKPPTKSGHS
jgi:hypothetical protein